MDPNVTLKEIRDLVRDVDNAVDGKVRMSTQGLADAAEEIADKFRELDEWVSKGGFLPKAWQQPAGTGHHWTSMPNLED